MGADLIIAPAGGQSRAAQSAVSKMERGTDMYISTLRTVIKAMGGELEIRAVFPQGTVRINQFSAIDEGAGTKRRETAQVNLHTRRL